MVRLIVDLLSLSGSVGIYFSYYAVFFKPPLNIGYVHQNLQLMPSATYPVFLKSRKRICEVEWCEIVPFKLPKAIFSKPNFAVFFLVMLKDSRKEGGKIVSKSLKLGFEHDEICIHVILFGIWL